MFAITTSQSAPDGEQLLGSVALLSANPTDLSLEIGHVRVFAQHRGSGIATAAGRLLLAYSLDPPEKGGLGLVRVEWHASTRNAASIAVAERKLGMERIGVVRYERFMEAGRERGKTGNGREGPPALRGREGWIWRDLVMFAAYWDTWEGPIQRDVD